MLLFYGSVNQVNRVASHLDKNGFTWVFAFVSVEDEIVGIPKLCNVYNREMKLHTKKNDEYISSCNLEEN